jgi:hypothetical protein
VAAAAAVTALLGTPPIPGLPTGSGPLWWVAGALALLTVGFALPASMWSLRVSGQVSAEKDAAVRAMLREIRQARAVLTERERTLGADHPDTLDARHATARAYARSGRHRQAVPLFESTLTGRERVLGADHPDTLTARHLLASSHRLQGRYDLAVGLLTDTRDGRARVLGADHPDTLAALDELADTHTAAGRPEHAVPLYEDAVTDRARVLGPDHPDTLDSRYGLTVALSGPDGPRRPSR